ncbi:MAG: FAD-dependent oxidoreductase, partial [Simkaniaceae bacterium]|nr:FAD-dependent oxidoreductase [Simkaniaceae bacterium]
MVTHPVASTARLIENIVIESYESDYMALRGAYTVLSRLISVTVFPAFLAIETLFACPLKIILSIGTDQFGKSIDNMVKCALSFFATPLNLYAPEGVTGFFLRCDEPNAVRPFGVEKIFGREVDEVKFPTTVVELKAIVAEAKAKNKQISIIGAGFSQGTQTVPKDDKHIVINMQKFKEMQLDDTTVTVGSGATWEMLQDLLNTCGKSTIVKQASDPFSIGGSIGINCHGWAHDAGAIASTVTEMQIIDAEGNYKTLKPGDEQFGCMFGTLGYFGIIVNVTFKIVPNEYLIESTEEVSIDECAENYEGQIKDHPEIPLFGGRLKLDQTSGNP